MITDKAISLLEEAYSKYLMKEIDANKLCKNIKVALDSMPFENGNKEFTVQITNQRSNERFFGMRVFPKINELNDFCKDVVNDSYENSIKFMDLVKKWRSIDNWFLELDGMLFDRNSINFTPKELVALTLHEIGHIIYSNKPVEGFYRAYKETKVRMTVSDRATQKLMYAIYMIPLSIACMQRRWVNSKNQINVEIIADKTVAELGYGEYLISAFTKIMTHFGSIASNENMQQDEINSSVEWCNKNITDIMGRKEKLKDELYYQGIKSKSTYLKAIVIRLLDTLGFKLKERYTGYAVENSIELLSEPNLMDKYVPIIDALESAKFDKKLQAMISSEEIALESIFNHRKKIKVQLPSQYEVDAISIEYDKITNHYDRIYVLDLIYEVLERINNFEEAISPDPSLVRKWSGKINTMKAELDEIRKATLAKKVVNNGSYKFFVKLPEAASDYEG